jgi:RNA polymerase sigma-70 factor (sigma-E family)
MTFEEFAETRLPALLAFAIVLTGQRATAEDVTQEVLIRAHGRWDQIARLDRPELYVRKMVLNEFLSWRRRSWRTVPAANPVPVQDRTADHAAACDEHAAMVAQIGKLPRRQRAVLALRYYEDRSDAEIAELLGCTPSAVRAYASRALAALRRELGPDQSGWATPVSGEI